MSERPVPAIREETAIVTSTGTEKAGDGGPPTTTVVKRKVCLVGEEGVGKTSLVRRFVTGQFAEQYIRTLGAVVWKKSVILIDLPVAPVRVDMVILDIIGKRTFMQMFRDAYFQGAAGILAVFDLTRRRSLDDLVPWIAGVREAVGEVPFVVLGNKADLAERVDIQDAQIEGVLDLRGARVFRTSAKTGENVEDAFLNLARGIVS